MKRLKNIVKKNEKTNGRKKEKKKKKEGKKGERKGTISQPGNSNESEDSWLLISTRPQPLPFHLLTVRPDSGFNFREC